MNILPSDLQKAIYGPVPNDIAIKDLHAGSNEPGRHQLNNGAFGRSYKACSDLAKQLR